MSDIHRTKLQTSSKTDTLSKHLNQLIFQMKLVITYTIKQL